MNKLTKRELVEKILINKFSEIKPYTPEKSEILNKFKDGTFGLSNLAFTLYSNGHNLRGKSKKHPYGLMYHDGKTLFSIGYYRKQYDPENEDGYLFFVTPRGNNTYKKIIDLVNIILSNTKIPCKGIYIRFLSLKQFIVLLRHGFLPAKENPWHDDSPEEDETLTNSLLCIKDILSSDGKVKSLYYGSRNSRKKSRITHNRFRNFLKRNYLDYSLRFYTPDDFKTAKKIVQTHFDIIGENGEPIGSTAEDHFNSIDTEITKLKDVKAYLGYLGKFPVSYFAGEKVSDSRFALYTPFTLRSPEVVLPHLKIKDEEFKKGFSAMPIFSYIELLRELQKEGIKEVLFGGSEHKDLNRIKRQLGCKNDPSYWVVKTR